jgi:PAS domain S-box-containing protein
MQVSETTLRGSTMGATPSEPDFKALFQAVLGLYLVLTPKLRIVAASDAYLRATMTARDDIIGCDLFDVFPDNPGDPGATGETNLRTSLERVRQFRMPDAMAIQKYDVRRPDGTFEERYWSPLNVPILDDAGEVTWIIHRVQDVTQSVHSMRDEAERATIAREQEVFIQQLRRANEELLARQTIILEREAHIRSVLDTAPDAIITIDERGIILSFSIAAEKLFGYPAGEVIGRNVKMLMPSPHREAHDAHLERYHRTGERHVVGIGRQVEAQRKDGSIFPMELAVGEVRAGRSHIFTGFIRDLTARLKIEEQLRQAHKMEAMGQLTGGVAHDFNNLLTVISGNLEMLERRLRTEDERELLREAQEATQLGAQLSRRLLAIGRRQALNPKPVDLSALVGGTVGLLRRSLGESVEIETRLARRLPLTSADPGQVENALLNLAINARDAMPGGGRLTIETVSVTIDADNAVEDPELLPGSYVVLAVSDTGSGMTSDALNRAFEPFFTTKKEGAGSGLGLSMVFGFVKQSGGHVRLYSEVGHGTTVRLYLPVDQGSAATDNARTSVGASRRGTGERVLVVEDRDRVRRLTVRRLSELGYASLEADSGSSALALLDRGESVDLLFTDIVLPGGMTGIELAHKVRALRPGVRILFTSGFAEPDKLRRGVLTVNAAWLAKPYGIGELQAKLQELLSR